MGKRPATAEPVTYQADELPGRHEPKKHPRDYCTSSSPANSKTRHQGGELDRPRSRRHTAVNQGQSETPRHRTPAKRPPPLPAASARSPASRSSSKTSTRVRLLLTTLVWRLEEPTQTRSEGWSASRPGTLRNVRSQRKPTTAPWGPAGARPPRSTLRATAKSTGGR
jgi:hypothetical protein